MSRAAFSLSPTALLRAALCGPLLSLPAAASDGDDWGEALMQRAPWQACLYCHNTGPGGGSASVPRLHGQSAGYIRKQLAELKKQEQEPDE